MKAQIQAQNNLQAFSLQLTNYLNDWVIQDKNSSKSNIRSSFNLSKKYQHNMDYQKSHHLKEKLQMCPIQFPIIQSTNKTSRVIALPPIKYKSQLSRQRLIAMSSEKKLIKSSFLKCRQKQIQSTHSLQRHQKQILFKIKRKNKRNLINKNCQSNIIKKTMQLDVSELKALLNRQLKNNRKSALKINQNDFRKDH